MVGVVDGGVGVGLGTSPRQAAIEEAKAELRQELDVREKRRRELEFLEKGGNPLDFKFGNATSVIQSASFANQQPEHIVTSKAKGSFLVTASPYGESVESSGRQRDPPSNCDSAHNLFLFGVHKKLPEEEMNLGHLSTKNDILSAKRLPQLYVDRIYKDPEDSAIFRPYARRNRSRSNRNVARSSFDTVQNHCDQRSSLPTVGESTESSLQNLSFTKVAGACSLYWETYWIHHHR